MFDIEKSEDFYRKLVEDYDDFMASPSSARLALNCILTAYHLYEWVWGDWLKSDRALKSKLNIRTKADFLKWIDSVWGFFPLIQDLANGTKHFGRPQAIATHKVVSFGPLPAGPDGKGYLALDLSGAGEGWGLMPAAHLIEGTVRFWRDFFKAYRPMPNMPVSRHHLDFDLAAQVERGGEP
jgi:hypothetical protein